MLPCSFRTLALLVLVCAIALLEVDGHDVRRRDHKKHRKRKQGDHDDEFDVDGPTKRSLEIRAPFEGHRRHQNSKNGKVDGTSGVEGRSKRSLVARRAPRKTLKQKTAENKNAVLRILLTSDSHGKAGADWTYATAHKLPDADVLIHCGDITDLGRQGEYQTVIDYFSKHSAKKKLFIGGNHDLTLDTKYMLENARDGVKKPENPVPPDLRGSTHKILHESTQAHWSFLSASAKKANVEFLEEGMHTIQVTNSENKNLSFKIFVSPYTPALRNYAYGYDAANEKRFNTHGHPNWIPGGSNEGAGEAPDFIITHGPPKGILDLTTSGVHGGDQNLFDAVARVKPIFHAFGHIHEAAGVEKLVWADEKGNTKDRDKITDDIIDLTTAKHDYKKGDATIFLNVSEKDKDFKNTNPWKLFQLQWGTDAKAEDKKNYSKVRKTDRKAKIKAGVHKIKAKIKGEKDD